MKRKTELALLLFKCPSCGRRLVWTVSGATVRCPKCGVWFTAEEAKARGRTGS